MKSNFTGFLQSVRGLVFGSSLFDTGVYYVPLRPLDIQRSGPKAMRELSVVFAKRKFDASNLGDASPLLKGFSVSSIVVAAPPSLEADLLLDLRSSERVKVKPQDVINRVVGVDEFVQTAVGSLLDAVNIDRNTPIEYNQRTWEAGMSAGVIKILTDLGVTPTGGNITLGGETLQEFTAADIALYMGQSQNVTDFAALSSFSQSEFEDAITASEKFKVGSNEVSYQDFMAKLKDSFGSTVKWYPNYVTGDCCDRSVVLTPPVSVVECLQDETVAGLLRTNVPSTSGTVYVYRSIVRYVFINILQRFPAYVTPSLAGRLYETPDNSNDAAFLEFVRMSYSQSDPLGEFLRKLFIYVKNMASLSQPLDVGMTKAESRVATLGLQIIGDINREASNFTTVEARRALTGEQILAIEAKFDAMRQEVYRAMPLARIASFNISDIPGFIFARVRAATSTRPDAAIRSKALAVRAYRTLEYLRYVSDPSGYTPLKK